MTVQDQGQMSTPTTQHANGGATTTTTATTDQTSQSQPWYSSLLSAFAVSRPPIKDEETAPLLAGAPPSSTGLYGAGESSNSGSSSGTTTPGGAEGNNDDNDDDGLKHAPKTTWWQEMATLARFAAPVIFSSTLQQALNVTSLVSVGRIGKIELGAVSLATMTSAMVFNAPMAGLSTSLDTLCSQAYGSGNKHLVGLQMQRMILFLACCCVPVLFFFFNAGSLLGLVVPGKESTELAGRYLSILSIGIPGVVLYEAGKRFLQAQGLFRAVAYSLALAVPVNVFLNWFLVWKMGMGFDGAPLAVAISQLTLPLGLLVYVVFVDGSQCWGGFSRRAFVNWGHMVRLAIPGMMQVWAEWISFEVLAILASQFGPDYLAAHTIMGCFVSVIYQPPFALGVATSTRVAQWIGAGKVKAAVKAAEVGYVASWIVALLDFALIMLFANRAATFFTTDPDVLALVSKTMTAMALLHIIDALAAMSHALIRGLGRQKIGGISAAFMYWVIGLPLSWYLAFTLDWRLSGLWAGISVGLLGVNVLELTYVGLMDWHKAAREANVRNAAN